MMAKERILTPMDRLIMRAVADDETLGNPDDPGVASYPSLWDWLTRTAAGKGFVKEPARIAIKAVPSGFLATLSDQSLKVALDVTSSDLEAVFRHLENALMQDGAAIRPYGRGDVKLRKRKT